MEYPTHAPVRRARPLRVLVLGGGFGGVHVARHLERIATARMPLDVTIVSRENFFLFTPMLHEVAASDLDLTHIVSPLRALLRRTTVIVGDVESIDLEARRVLVSHGFDRHAHEVAYDHLVIGLGSITNFYGLPGLESHALTMKTLGDAIHLRNRVIATLEEADTECAVSDDGLLTFVVAGGGFAGVETIGALNDFVRDALKYYPRLAQRRIRMILVHAGATILPELGDTLGRYAERKLADRGLDILTSRHVTRVTHEGVWLDDETFIRARMVVWTAGTSPHPLLGRLPCRIDHGRVAVESTLAVPGWPGVWALGDCAMIPDPATGRPYPPTAQHALREARTVARNIVASGAGTPLEPFTFRTLGQLAAIGRRTGVARILGVNFSGFLAWWLWRTIYLGKLPRIEKKIRVALDWTLDLIFTKDFVQFLTIRGAVTSSAHTPASDAPPVEAPRS